MQALGRETWQPNIPVKGYCAPLLHLQKIETCPEMSGGRWKQVAPGCLEVDVYYQNVEDGLGERLCFCYRVESNEAEGEALPRNQLGNSCCGGVK